MKQKKTEKFFILGITFPLHWSCAFQTHFRRKAYAYQCGLSVMTTNLPLAESRGQLDQWDGVKRGVMQCGPDCGCKRVCACVVCARALHTSPPCSRQ